MNLWSMSPEGTDLQQHTLHKGWDVKWPALSQGKVVYQLGADLRLYDIALKTDLIIPITLTSDFDHQREKWVKKPLDFVRPCFATRLDAKSCSALSREARALGM